MPDSPDIAGYRDIPGLRIQFLPHLESRQSVDASRQSESQEEGQQAALPYLETALELNPNDFFATWVLCLTHTALGELDEAEAAIQQLEALTGADAFSMSSRAELYIARGDEISARGMLKQMIDLHDAGNEEPALVPFIGIVFGLLGEVEEAINWFERGAATPSPLGTLLPIIVFYDHPAIWNHPRYQALMEKTNLDDASVATAKAAVASQ